MGAAQACCCSDKEPMKVESVTAVAAPMAEPEPLVDAQAKAAETAPADASPAPEPAPASAKEETSIAADTTAATEGLTITFGLPDGTLKDITFTQRPLGIDFTRTMPPSVKIVKPNCQAHGQVQVGWKVMKVDGDELPSEFDRAKDYLKDKGGPQIPDCKTLREAAPKKEKKKKKKKKKKSSGSDSDSGDDSDNDKDMPKSASGLDMMHSLTETGDGKKVKSPKLEKELSAKELKKASKAWSKQFGNLGGYSPSPKTLAGWYKKNSGVEDGFSLDNGSQSAMKSPRHSKHGSKSPKDAIRSPKHAAASPKHHR